MSKAIDVTNSFPSDAPALPSMNDDGALFGDLPVLSDLAELGPIGYFAIGAGLAIAAYGLVRLVQKTHILEA